MELSEELMNEFRAIAESAGCELVDARFGSGVLKITLDHPDGILLEHCQSVSKQVSAHLDVADWGTARYTLEVTSPGLDRELFRPRDFERFTGSRIKVTWRPPEGKRTDTGTLERFTSATDDPAGAHIEIRVDPDQTRRIPLQSIDIARLVPEF
jgi:ribosome maturation factor RimP